MKIQRQGLAHLVAFFWLGSGTIFSGGASWAAAALDPNFNLPVAANEIKIMAYNVENLFDWTHDQNKSDFEYLPAESGLKKQCESQSPKSACVATDWTKGKVQLKLGQIKKAIGAQGSLPDILVLEEVENPNVIGMLATILGFQKFVMTNSPDERGIDVAILFNEQKLTFLSWAEKILPYQNLKTRNLIAANFKFKAPYQAQGVLSVFGNHWPSQAKPSEDRVAAAKSLREFVTEVTGKYGSHAVITGDFNTEETDKPNAIKEVVLDQASKLPLYDVQPIFEKGNTAVEIPPGSYFYDNAWSKLDHFFVTKNLLDGKGLDLAPLSFRIVAADFMTDVREVKGHPIHIPARYDVDAVSSVAAGFSDHFPIVVKLRLQNP